MKNVRTLFASLVIAVGFSSVCSAHFLGLGSDSLSDAQIASIILAVDNNEIGTAKTILAHKPKSNAVKAYAHHIEKQHEHNKKHLVKLMHDLKLMVTESTQSKSITADGVAESAKIKSLNMHEAEVLYMKDAVDGHRGGLKLINTTLLKDVHEPKLKAFLESTRSMVQQHLDRAMTIEKKDHI